ncbi:paralemmin-1-like isoform X2 [Oryzias latipes]|uniref:paralemmin-1-like isoform X2 n=1 Tax=Oryzias latipes TaxID=8090 RepID=UPI000CE1E5A0|nr:paralemmin-1-like isoform X2 [Oryzias latipes]
MDEAEKYKQRLDAIAEKRRLQEEEDRVKREKEEERIKQRQLKRKSLREQWLMEPAPLSPTYQKSPESPTRSKGETQESPEAPEKQAGDGRTKTVQVEDARNELVLQNGEKGASKPETPEDEGKRNQTPAEVETAVVLTNGGGVPDSNGVSELGESNKHGASEGAENVRVHGMGVIDQIPNDSVLEKEEEEGTLVMRAECVLITDEGDDVSQELTSQEDQQGSVESDKAHLLDPEAGKEKGVAVEEAVKTETPPEALGKSEEEDPPVEPQSQTRPLEGVTVTAVPVYTEAPLPILSSANEGKDAASADTPEAAPKTPNLSAAPTQFQEVPLTGPQDKQDNNAGPGEQEPLLLKVEASNRASEAPAAGGNSPASAETQIQSRGESKTPKQKTCQCCSVM